jgi:uncharacterized protein
MGPAMNLTPLETVRRYYEALIPGHRADLMDLLDPHFVLELPPGLVGCAATYKGLKEYIQDFLFAFYGYFDVRLIPEEFVASGDRVVTLGRMEGQALPRGTPVNVAFAHVWTVRRGMILHCRMYADTAVLCQAITNDRSRAVAK